MVLGPSGELKSLESPAKATSVDFPIREKFPVLHWPALPELGLRQFLNYCSRQEYPLEILKAQGAHALRSKCQPAGTCSTARPEWPSTSPPSVG